MTVTHIFLVAIIAATIGWTIYMLATGGTTVSQVVYQMNELHPVFPFLAGFVCGHFWFPRAKR